MSNWASKECNGRCCWRETRRAVIVISAERPRIFFQGFQWGAGFGVAVLIGDLLVGKYAAIISNFVSRRHTTPVATTSLTRSRRVLLC